MPLILLCCAVVGGSDLPPLVVQSDTLEATAEPATPIQAMGTGSPWLDPILGLPWELQPHEDPWYHYVVPLAVAVVAIVWLIAAVIVHWLDRRRARKHEKRLPPWWRDWRRKASRPSRPTREVH